MYFTLQISCFVLSLDSSACLGNKILPDMYSHIFTPSKTDENVANISSRSLTTSARSLFNKKKKSRKKYGTLKANYRQCIKVFY